MPRLPQYFDENASFRPTDTGVEAYAEAGRRIGAFYQQAGQAERQAAEAKAQGAEGIAAGTRALVGSLDQGVRSVVAGVNAAQLYASHNEISQGGPHEAAAISGLTDSWNSTFSDSLKSDPNTAGMVQAKWMQSQFEPWAEKWVNSFNTPGGRDWAEERVAQLRDHFQTKTAADVSTAAGIATISNAEKSATAWASTALSDPSAVPMLLDTARSYFQNLGGSNPHLSPVDQARLMEETLPKAERQIVRGGAIGVLQNASDPVAAAKHYIAQYPDYVDVAETTQFARMAQYYNRLNQSEARAAQAQRDYDNKADFNAKAAALEASTAPQNAGDPPSLPKDYWDQIRSLSSHPGVAFEPGRLMTLINAGESITSRLNKPEPLGRVSHDTTMQLLGDLRAGKMTDNGPIYQAYQEGKLDRADFQFMQNEYSNLRTPAGQMLNNDRKLFMDRFSRLIDGAMTDTGIPSLLGQQRLYDFEMDARQQEANLRSHGQDPHLVYNPSSQYFFGRPENIAKYRVSLQQAHDYDVTIKSMDKANAAAQPASPTKPTPGPLVRQNGHTYQRQPDGSYKAVD